MGLYKQQGMERYKMGIALHEKKTTQHHFTLPFTTTTFSTIAEFAGSILCTSSIIFNMQYFTIITLLVASFSGAQAGDNKCNGNNGINDVNAKW